MIAPLLEDFTAATGIAVEVKYAGSADLALLVDQEGERSPADVFISQSPGAIGFLADRGHLQPIAEVQLDLVDPEFRQRQRPMESVCRGGCECWSTTPSWSIPADLPTSIFELTEPQYLAGWVWRQERIVPGLRDCHAPDSRGRRRRRMACRH